MAQPGNFTPILLYASSTPTNIPSAGNLTNSATGSEIAINIADKNLFFKDSGGTVNTVPIRQSSASSNGWLSSTDWSTFNGKAPATSGTSILYGNGTGGFSNVTIGSGISFAGGTLSATGTGGTVTSVAALTLGTTGTDLSSTVANGTTTPVITLNVPTASAANRGALSAADWSTFNGKQAALVSGTNIKTVGGVTLLGSGDVGTIGVGYGGTGTATAFTAGSVVFAGASGVYSQDNANLFWDNTNKALGIGISTPASWGKLAIYDGTVLYSVNLYTPGLTCYAGTSSAHALAFITSNAERVRISAAGGVSIGNTTDPGATNLSVTGVIKIGTKQAVNGPAFSAYASGSQATVTAAVTTKVVFDSLEYDTNSNFSTANSRFTPTVAGYYIIGACASPTVSAANSTLIFIFKNGSLYKRLSYSANGTNLVNGASLVYFNGSTDYVEIYVYFTAINSTFYGGSDSQYFYGSMVRGA